MRDAVQWRQKAASLRDRARTTPDAERERVYNVLAEDCEQIAARIERGGQPISAGGPR